MPWYEPEPDDRLNEILDNTRCALCPNIIGSEAFSVVSDADVIQKLRLLAANKPQPLDVIQKPNGTGEIVLVHLHCLAAADQVNKLEDGL